MNQQESSVAIQDAPPEEEVDHSKEWREQEKQKALDLRKGELQALFFKKVYEFFDDKTRGEFYDTFDTFLERGIEIPEGMLPVPDSLLKLGQTPFSGVPGNGGYGYRGYLGTIQKVAHVDKKDAQSVAGGYHGGAQGMIQDQKVPVRVDVFGPAPYGEKPPLIERVENFYVISADVLRTQEGSITDSSQLEIAATRQYTTNTDAPPIILDSKGDIDPRVFSFLK